MMDSQTITSNAQKKWYGRHARFTLVEMLVVITIIATLAALLLPSLQAGLAVARTVDCSNLQRQLYVAFTQFADDNHGVMPIAKFNQTVNAAYKTELFPPVSSLSDNILGFSYPSGRNLLRPYTKSMASISCPVDPHTPAYNANGDWWVAKSNYLLVLDRFSMCYRNPWGSDSGSVISTFSKIKTPGRQLMLLENDINSGANTNTCGKGYSWAFSKFSYSHNRDSGSNAMFCDGHIRFIHLSGPVTFTLDYKNSYLYIPGEISKENWE